MAEPSRVSLQLQRVAELQSALRSCIDKCEPCAFQIRDVHNAIISTVKPLIESQQALLTNGSKCATALREVHAVAKECAASATELQTEILALRSTQDLAGELAGALNKLRSQPVDPSFIGGESGHTLYDFVDESSVDSLQQQLQAELNEMEALYRSCFATVTSFDQQVRYLNGFLGAVMPVVFPSGAEDTSAVDAVGVLMTALKARCTLPAVDTVELTQLQVLMQSWKTYAMELEVSVVSLASSVSQVENLQTRLLALRDRPHHRVADQSAQNTDLSASSNFGPHSPDSRASARSRTQSDSVVDMLARVQLGSGHGNSARTVSTDPAPGRTEEELRHLLAELESCERVALERIRVGDALAQSWEGRMQEFNVIRWCARATQNLQQSALQRMRGAALESDRIMQATRERRAPFDEGVRRFAVLKQSVDALRQELNSLSYFYQEFATAYTALQSEMKRRHEAIATLQSAVQQAQDALRSYSATETDVRRRFLETYGQFLPVSLCPEVQDPAPTFEIVPSLAEALKRIPIPSAQSYNQAPEQTTSGPAEEGQPQKLPTPIVREPVAASNRPPVSASADSVTSHTSQPGNKADGDLESTDTLHQPKPRRVMQSGLYGSDLPSTVVFSPSPTARGAASPLEVPPFAISPVANPLPELLQLIESLGGSGSSASVTDRFHFSGGADLPDVPERLAASPPLSSADSAAAYVPPAVDSGHQDTSSTDALQAAIAEATKTEPQASAAETAAPGAPAASVPQGQRNLEPEEAEGTDWVHF